MSELEVGQLKKSYDNMSPEEQLKFANELSTEVIKSAKERGVIISVASGVVGGVVGAMLSYQYGPYQAPDLETVSQLYAAFGGVTSSVVGSYLGSVYAMLTKGEKAKNREKILNLIEEKK